MRTSKSLAPTFCPFAIPVHFREDIRLAMARAQADCDINFVLLSYSRIWGPLCIFFKYGLFPTMDFRPPGLA